MNSLRLVEEQEPGVKQGSLSIAGIGVEIPGSASPRAERVGGADCLGVADRVKGDQGFTTPSVAAAAARSALKDADLSPKSIQQIVVGTTSPDVLWPSTACLVQTELGIGMAPAFDLYAGDASGLTALAVADRLVRAGAGPTLVIAADSDNQLVDLPGQSAREMSKRTIGAGCLVLSGGGSHAELLATVSGGSARSNRDAQPSDLVDELAGSTTACLKRAGVSREEIASVIYDPRQAELIQCWAERFGIDRDRLSNRQAARLKGGSVAIFAALAQALAIPSEIQSRKTEPILLISTTSGPAWAIACVRIQGEHTRDQ